MYFYTKTADWRSPIPFGGCQFTFWRPKLSWGGFIEKGWSAKRVVLWIPAIKNLDRPKRILKSLRFEHASPNASGFHVSLYSIVYKWIFDTRVFSTQLKSNRQMTLCFASNRPCVLKTRVFADLSSGTKKTWNGNVQMHVRKNISEQCEGNTHDNVWFWDKKGQNIQPNFATNITMGFNHHTFCAPE